MNRTVQLLGSSTTSDTQTLTKTSRFYKILDGDKKGSVVIIINPEKRIKNDRYIVLTIQ